MTIKKLASIVMLLLTINFAFGQTYARNGMVTSSSKIAVSCISLPKGKIYG